MNKKEALINKWKDVEFESNCYPTEQFSAFSKEFKAYIKKVTGESFDLVAYSKGHFEVSCFLQSKWNKKFAYLSIPDVRFFQNGWFENILVRTAENEKDYGGGSNHACKLEALLSTVLDLIDRR